MGEPCPNLNCGYCIPCHPPNLLGFRKKKTRNIPDTRVVFTSRYFILDTRFWNQNKTNKIAHLLSSDCVQWLIEQAKEGNWSKEDVGSVVCRQNSDNQLILATLDEETQKQVAVFNKEKTNEVAHLLSADFQHWLIQQAKEGQWSKEDVGSIVCKKNTDNQLILATLDMETQKQVAQFNQERTNEVAHLMSAEFIEWLLLEASAGRWSKEDVGSIMFRKNADNQLVLGTLDEKTPLHFLLQAI